MLSTIALLSMISWGPLQAGDIHKWVDAKGVTHYSDSPPEEPQSIVTTLELETGGSRDASPKPADDYYSIANQWQRMHRESLQRQEIALQKAALRNERRTAPAPVQYRERESTRYVLAYPKRRYHRYRHHPKAMYPHKPPSGIKPLSRRSSGFPTR